LTQPPQEIAGVAAGQMNGVTGKQPADLRVAGKRVEIDEEIEGKPLSGVILPFLVEKLPLRLRAGGEIADAVTTRAGERGKPPVHRRVFGDELIAVERGDHSIAPLIAPNVAP